MNELIKITERDGKKAVSAKDLYEFLGYDQSQFSRFCISKISSNDFAIENVDYERFDTMVDMPNGGRKSVLDYAISLDFAKRLAMMAKTEKGEKVRLYFIECEKQLRKPLTQSQLILQSAQMLVDFERKQNLLEERLAAIESNPHVNAEIQHFTIMGYCRNINKQVGLVEASTLGRKCTAICKELGFTTGHVNDPRFGSVKTYPLSVLEEIVK